MSSALENRKKVIIVIAAIVIVTGLVGTAVVINNTPRRHSMKNTEFGIVYAPDAVMSITNNGGLCASPGCVHETYNIYDDGEFDDHKKLSRTEISRLKQIIDSTNFKQYARKSDPNCQSIMDGIDLVLLFPQKHGSETFYPCTLDIARDDETFIYIDQLLKSRGFRSSIFNVW